MSLVPQPSMNLKFVGQLTDIHYFIGFNDSSCYMQNGRTKTVISTGHRRSGSGRLYVLDRLSLCFPSITPTLSTVPASTLHVQGSAFPTSAIFPQWHHRLGHLYGSRLSFLVH